MSAENFFRRGLSDGGPVGSVIKGFLGPSEEERKARAADQAAQNAAQDELAFNKATAAGNNRTIDDVIAKIFGGAPSGTSAGSASSKEASRDPGAPQYGDDNYFGGGSQPGDISRGGFADNPDLGSDNVSPADSIGNRSAESGMSGGGGFYPGALSNAEGMDREALDSFLNDMGGMTPAQISDALKDIESQVKIGQDTRDAQKFSLDSLKGLANPQETAQEKLIREMARRTMEGQMKGDREAMAQSLKARGVYGSGAELAKQLSTQQQLADERQLSELGANAQASKRAMDALGKYTDLGVQLGNQDIAVGSALDKASEFNNALKEQHNQFTTKAQQTNNDQLARTAGAKLAAKGNVASNVRNDAGNEANLLTTLAGLRTGTATSGANLVRGANQDAIEGFKRSAATARAGDNSDEGLLGIL